MAPKLALSQFAAVCTEGASLVLYHTANRKTLRLPSTVYARLRDGGLQSVPRYYLLLLARGGFIVTDRAAERDALRAAFAQRQLRRDVLQITVIPSYNCNCACPDCYQREYADTHTMSWEIALQAVNFVRSELERLRPNRMVAWFYGGEPFLYAGLCRRIGRELRKLCESEGVPYRSFAATNATLLTRSKSKSLLEEIDEIYVGMSQSNVDQAAQRPFRAGGNSWRTALAGIAAADRLEKRITVRFNIGALERLADDLTMALQDIAAACGGQSENLRFVFSPFLSAAVTCAVEIRNVLELRQRWCEITELIRNLVPRLPWNATSFHLPTDKFVPNFSQAYEMQRCPYLKREAFLISPCGDIHLCNELKNDDRFRIGNVARPESIYGSGLYLRALTSSAFDDPVCRECSFLPKCAMECTAGTLLHSRQRMHSPGCRELQQQRIHREVSALAQAGDRA